ncbi:MAG TPA: pitrilysin family protein [Phycisphaerales bacterium]|nr:pitrilysin family protein [Phycisphaerales bacterium]HMP37554.1 pitrilysin family protein [Phycisphaerales bacterium]
MPLLVEAMPGVRSAALTWLLPVGSAAFDDAEDGHAALLAEFVLRGAGGLDSRQHSEALARLGVQRSAMVFSHHIQLGATMLGSRLAEALPLIAAMVTAPALPESALESVRSLALQALDGLDDDPQLLVLLRLKERHQPHPLNRHGYGVRSVLESASAEQLRAAWKRRAVPAGSILAVAGDVDPDSVESHLNRLLSEWRGGGAPAIATSAPQRGTAHIEEQTAQTHLALAWDAPREAEPTSMRERLLVRVLGSGSSSRLFTEVREKRGLCYSVSASYSGGRDRGMISVYAGSTPERASTTLAVILAEVERLRQGVEQAEYRRAVVGLKSQLVMQGESTAARSASLAGDQFRLGRPRTLAEIAAEVDRVTLDELNAHAAARRFEPMTQVSIGPNAPEPAIVATG